MRIRGHDVFATESLLGCKSRLELIIEEYR